jgi:hypothetical protein
MHGAGDSDIRPACFKAGNEQIKQPPCLTRERWSTRNVPIYGDADRRTREFLRSHADGLASSLVLSRCQASSSGGWVNDRCCMHPVCFRTWRV